MSATGCVSRRAACALLSSVAVSSVRVFFECRIPGGQSMRPRAMMWPLLSLLTASLATVAGQVAEEPAPVFLAPVDNVTTTQGRSVRFSCVVDHLGEHKVAWIKADRMLILTVGMDVYVNNPSVYVSHDGHRTWRLHIRNVQRQDAGPYVCKVNAEPRNNVTGYLTVLVPPEIVNEDENAEPEAPEGGSMRMRCSATGDPPPAVIWQREDGRDIVLRLPDGQRAQSQVEGDTLLLSGVTRADIGDYLCIVSNGVPPAVSKRFAVSVRFRPEIKLVVTPQGSDVLLQCYVEASPRAINTWHSETGEKMFEDDGSKYLIGEQDVNEYAVLLNLTVRDVQVSDFGTYTCRSFNAVGRVEGSVRLQGMCPPQPTSRPDQHGPEGGSLSRGPQLCHAAHAASTAPPPGLAGRPHLAPLMTSLLVATLPALSGH